MYKNPVPPRFVMNRSAEYWTGWALAYYQWRSGLSFKNINEKVSIQDIFCMFHPYHEMDILQFCDKMDELVCT
jgi:hypothetical protein